MINPCNPQVAQQILQICRQNHQNNSKNFNNPDERLDLTDNPDNPYSFLDLLSLSQNNFNEIANYYVSPSSRDKSNNPNNLESVYIDQPKDHPNNHNSVDIIIANQILTFIIPSSKPNNPSNPLLTRGIYISRVSFPIPLLQSHNLNNNPLNDLLHLLTTQARFNYIFKQIWLHPDISKSINHPNNPNNLDELVTEGSPIEWFIQVNPPFSLTLSTSLSSSSQSHIHLKCYIQFSHHPNNPNNQPITIPPRDEHGHDLPLPWLAVLSNHDDRKHYKPHSNSDQECLEALRHVLGSEERVQWNMLCSINYATKLFMSSQSIPITLKYLIDKV